MMISGISSQNHILRPQIQDAGLQKVINQINATVGHTQNFDVLELSLIAQTFSKESSATKVTEAEAIPGYDNTEMVHSTVWGPHTKAEFAEMSLTSQRNDLLTFSDQIDYLKSKLTFTTEKISELENYLHGTGVHSDPNMTEELAAIHLHNYEQSIARDYSSLSFDRSQYHADEFDALSGGLASQTFENPLHSLDADSLGLSNLSADPEEIMKALDRASDIVKSTAAALERAFSDATGGKAFTEPARSWSIFDGTSSLSFFASQMETDTRMLYADLGFTGETFQIDIRSIQDLEAADVTP